MSLSKKTIKYALMFVGLLIFLACYFLVYMDYSTKTDALNTDISGLNKRLDTLSGYNSDLPKYKSSIEENKAAISDTLGKYYSAERPEDFIVLATDMEKNIGLTVGGLSFTDPVVIYGIAGVTDAKNVGDPVKPLKLTSFMVSSTITASMKYAQMKQALDYISSLKDVTKLDSLDLTLDVTTGLITGGFVLDKYYITGRDIPDHQTGVNYTNIGKSTLMGS